jgi:hypothetical protein
MKTMLNQHQRAIALSFKRRLSVAFVALSLLLVLASCEKEPGKGGLASIQGKVYGYDINPAGVVHDSGYAGGFKVYISYGDHDYTDASETTSPTGDYAFNGLQKGTYTLSVYSKCDTCLFNQVYFQQSAEITETRQVATMPNFVIYK